MVEGAGTEGILIAMGVVVVVIIAVIIYFWLRKRQAVYTYAYEAKKGA